MVNKQVFLSSDNKQYTEGFCGAKNPTGKYLDLSVIVIFPCDCITKLQKTMADIDKDEGFTKQVIIACGPKVNPLTRKTAIEVMRENCSKEWSMNVMLNPDLKTSDLMIDNTLNFVKSEWFLPIWVGNRFPWEKTNKALEILKDSNKNIVAFREVYGKWIINVRAFNELGRNEDMSFEEKIQTFENWEEVCELLP